MVRFQKQRCGQQYARQQQLTFLATDKRTNRQTDGRRCRVKPPLSLCDGGLTL